MRLQPIQGQPGLFRDVHMGQLVNTKDYYPWESSVHLEGMSAFIEMPASHIFFSWRLSCAKRPTSVEAQQQATLRAQEEILASLTVDSLLGVGCTFEQPHLAQQHSCVKVELTERPVEGCGLRVHVRGLSRYRP